MTMHFRTVSPCMLLLVLACAAGEGDSDNSIYNSYGSGNTMEAADTTDEASEAEASTGDGDPTTTGDGDPTTTGDGDPTTTGDGDPTTTGDGDPTTTGDGDPTTTGDGDGEPNPCGNGVIDQGEECDGGNLGGQSCTDFGFDGGVLSCDPVICVYDTSGCTNEMANECNQFCNGCTCPSFECTMCCALQDKVDVCGGGMCGCF